MGAIDDIYYEILFGLSTVSSKFLFGNQATVKELLSPTDVALLEKILVIGEKYWEIKNFLNEKAREEFNNQTVGLYMLSSLEYINRCLEPYRTTVTQLETGPHCLTHLYSRIFPYSEVLNGLAKLVHELKFCHVNGTLIVDTLKKHADSSTRSLQIATRFVYVGVCELLLTQIRSWVLYGEIHDTKREFFIHDKRTEESKNPFAGIQLCSKQLPNFISPLLAERILYVGQTVLYLRSCPDKSKGIFNSELYCKISVDIMRDKMKDIPSKIKDIVDIVGKVVTTQLRSYAMEDANLLQQLNMLKDLFLMGRGELFHEFVSQTEASFSKRTNLYTDLNLVLHACARKVLMKEESLQPFTLELVENEDGPKAHFTYSVPWPLELIFTSTSIAEYNKVFWFLLRLKRIQIKMVAAWLQNKSKRLELDCPNRRQLQHKLWFFINNLQYYLQVDVLDSQFLKLEAAIVASKDFEEVQRAHAKFISTLMAQTFLDGYQEGKGIISPVQQRLNNLLIVCEEFCTNGTTRNPPEMNQELLDKLNTRFDALYQQLAALLVAYKKHTSHPGCQYLSQLLLRLDYNKFLSVLPEVNHNNTF